MLARQAVGFAVDEVQIPQSMAFRDEEPAFHNCHVQRLTHDGIDDGDAIDQTRVQSMTKNKSCTALAADQAIAFFPKLVILIRLSKYDTAKWKSYKFTEEKKYNRIRNASSQMKQTTISFFYFK